MSGAKNRVLIHALFALAVMLPVFECVLVSEGQAGFQAWSFSRGKRESGKKSEIKFGFEAAGRMMFHYNRARVVSTPPESLLAEVQLQAWYKNRAMAYVLYGRSVALSTSQAYGGGVKIPFVGMESDGGFAITLALAADFVSYAIDPSVHPYSYPDSYSLFRYGGSIHLGLGASAVYLDGTLMLTTVNDNFFVAPLLGLGFRF